MIQTEAEAFWYLNLTESQQEGLKAFREQLIAKGALLKGHDDDPTLLRFLKARQWNVEPALVMYGNMTKWRKEHLVDECYANLDFPELKELITHYPHFYHKLDKYGRPVYIEKLGSTDCTRMLQVSPQDRIMNYHIWTWERLERILMPACSAIKGHPIITCTVILDLSGLSMKNFTLTTKRLLTAITKIDQDYYPEHLGTMFIINTPMIFSAIWAVVNPLLEERTRKKIMVLGANYLEIVKQLIPMENLPTIFGGTSVCKDYMNSEGPWTEVEPCKSVPWFPVGPKDGKAEGAASSYSNSLLSTGTTSDPSTDPAPVPLLPAALTM